MAGRPARRDPLSGATPAYLQHRPGGDRPGLAHLDVASLPGGANSAVALPPLDSGDTRQSVLLRRLPRGHSGAVFLPSGRVASSPMGPVARRNAFRSGVGKLLDFGLNFSPPPGGA